MKKLLFKLNFDEEINIKCSKQSEFNSNITEQL